MAFARTNQPAVGRPSSCSGGADPEIGPDRRSRADRIRNRRRPAWSGTVTARRRHGPQSSTPMTTAIRSVSDTALWVAMYRAYESERADALFSDPYARRLAGPRGEAI